MSEDRTMNLPTLLGTLLSRLIVPGWILTGAIVKLIEKTPTNLPSNLVDIGKWVSANLDIDLYLYLAFFLIIEFIAVGIMFLIPRLARATAIAMMSIFVLVLLGELWKGNFESCGCVGSIKVSPLVMLIIDGAMLIGLLALPSDPRAGTSVTRGWMQPIAALWLIAAVGVTAAVILPERRETEITIDNRGAIDDGSNPSDERNNPGGNANPGGTEDEADTPQDADGETDSPGRSGDPQPARRTLPGHYYFEGGASPFIGKRFLDVELAQFVSGWPEDIDEGRWYVVFYGPTCDHCLEIAERHLAGDLPVRLAMVAIPERKTGFLDNPYDFRARVDADVWLQLPIGCDWIFSTPIVFAVDDGVVECAIEEEQVDEPNCLIWN